MYNKIKALCWNQAERRLPWPLVGIAFVIVAVVLAGVLWKVPEWQVPAEVTGIKDRAQLENEFRKTLAQIVAGVVILVGVYYTAKRVAATERTAEAALKTVEVTQEGQITERFTRAIAQLGDDKIAICLGGIYALERIAKDSSKDDWQIMEVLTAYVREKARWQEDAPAGDGEEAHRMPTDIQAILTVLGRRERGHESEGQRLDLTGTDLRYADLEGAHLEGAFLFDAHLERANFIGAHLERATLRRAHLGWARFGEAHLEGAQLGGAHLERTFLMGAHLEGARLIGTHLENAYLVQANLGAARLGGANLEDASLRGAHLEGTDLRYANLSGVADLTQAQLDSTRSYEGATLPDYLKESTAAGQEGD